MADVGIYNMTDTWADAGTTFNAIRMNVTDTASAAGSQLLDLQVGGSSRFSVAKGGDVTVVDKIIHAGDTDTAIRFPANDTWTVEANGVEYLRVSSALGGVTELIGGVQRALVSQSDIGSSANEVPINQTLGQLAFVDDVFWPVTAGTGITGGTGTVYSASTFLENSLKRVNILIDLTGLNSGGTAGDIIGLNGTALPCHIGQLPSITVLGGRMTCLETPAGGDTDIDLYAASVGTGVEDAAISGLAGQAQIINAGSQTAGTVTYFSADPASTAFLYLVGQSTSNATYTAGRFLIEIFGV